VAAIAVGDSQRSESCAPLRPSVRRAVLSTPGGGDGSTKPCVLRLRLPGFLATKCHIPPTPMIPSTVGCTINSTPLTTTNSDFDYLRNASGEDLAHQTLAAGNAAMSHEGGHVLEATLVSPTPGGWKACVHSGMTCARMACFELRGASKTTTIMLLRPGLESKRRAPRRPTSDSMVFIHGLLRTT
jgi:hypothetical protein